MYYRCEYPTWDSLYDCCQLHHIQLADILVYTKYPVNTIRMIGFSEITHANPNTKAAMILDPFDCVPVTLDPASKPDFVTEDEWAYLVPKLHEHELFNKPINVFTRSPVASHTIHSIPAKSPIDTEVCEEILHSFSEYFIHVLYTNVSKDVPPELADVPPEAIREIFVREYL